MESPDDAGPGVWEGRLRLWLAIGGRNAIGPGKVRLLEAIAVTKSLAEAAKQLKMSYRLAWKHLRAIEQHTGMAIVLPQRGGYGGGGTDLTPDGKALVDAYRSWQHDVETYQREACQRYFAPWIAAPPPGSTPTWPGADSAS